MTLWWGELKTGPWVSWSVRICSLSKNTFMLSRISHLFVFWLINTFIRLSECICSPFPYVEAPIHIMYALVVWWCLGYWVQYCGCLPRQLLNDSLAVVTASSEGDVKRYTSHLHLTDMQDSMAGRYQCVVSNDFGSTFSQKAYINVYGEEKNCMRYWR